MVDGTVVKDEGGSAVAQGFSRYCSDIPDLENALPGAAARMGGRECTPLARLAVQPAPQQKVVYRDLDETVLMTAFALQPGVGPISVGGTGVLGGQGQGQGGDEADEGRKKRKRKKVKRSAVKTEQA